LKQSQTETIDEAFPPIQTVTVKEELVIKKEVKPETNLSSESIDEDLVP
jgi:hypothetical protein